jgi:hypothetical protein
MAKKQNGIDNFYQKSKMGNEFNPLLKVQLKQYLETLSGGGTL